MRAATSSAATTARPGRHGRITRALLGVLAIGILSLLFIVHPSAARADGDPDDFRFESLHADYTLSRDDDGTSRVRVVETFVAVFPDSDQNRGMRRGIETRFNDQPTRPQLISITDGDGNPRPAETDTDDGEYVMTSRADEYLHGAQTFVFTYTLEHVTWPYGNSDADEFNWNIVGTDHAQPYGTVSVVLHVPGELAGALTGNSACYFGARGETKQCTVATGPGDGQGVTIEAQLPASGTDALGPDQAMTLAVGFTKGTFTSFDANPFATPWGWLQAGGLAIGLSGVVTAFAARRRALADEPGRGTVIAQYEPPAGIDALHGAVFLGKKGTAIPAEVLEQALAGSLRIIQGEKTFWGKGKLVAEFIGRGNADEDGRMLLRALFGDGRQPGAQYTFGTTDSDFAKASQTMLAKANTDLTSRGFYRSVRAKAYAWPVLVMIVGLVATIGFGAAVIASGAIVGFSIAAIVAVALLLFIGIGLLIKRPLTRKGAELREHLDGLKIFIDWAEADRIRMLQSVSGAERVAVDTNDPRQMLRLYEPLLPWAVVFGQEKEWSEQLAVLYGDGSPGWYVGSGSFNAAAFSAGIGSLSAASASSSSTGGSTGGGSAGGGGGGGSTGGV